MEVARSLGNEKESQPHAHGAFDKPQEAVDTTEDSSLILDAAMTLSSLAAKNVKKKLCRAFSFIELTTFSLLYILGTNNHSKRRGSGGGLHCSFSSHSRRREARWLHLWQRRCAERRAVFVSYTSIRSVKRSVEDIHHMLSALLYCTNSRPLQRRRFCIDRF